MAYRIGDFAALVGVTVRALQHYDRLGLLKPSRTEAGHRVYSVADQQRVRHILALRAVGMSLQGIRETLTAPPARVPELFKAQRASLEQSRTGIDEAIGALERLEAVQDDSGTEPLLDRLATAVEMQDVLEGMRGYFSDAAWTTWGERYFYDWPSAAWRVLFRDIESSLPEDPDSERGRELLRRWSTLWRSEVGSDPAVVRAIREGFGRAWGARERWPPEFQRRYSEFKIEALAKFIGEAAMASWRREGLMHTYTAGQGSSA